MNSNDLRKAISALEAPPPKISFPVQSTLIMGPQDWPAPILDDSCDDRSVSTPPADVIPKCRIWGHLIACDVEGMRDFSERLSLVRKWMNSLGEARRITGELTGVSSDCLNANDPLSCWLIHLHESGRSEVTTWKLDASGNPDWLQVQWRPDDSNVNNRKWPPIDAFALTALGRSRISDAIAESCRVSAELVGRLKLMISQQVATELRRSSPAVETLKPTHVSKRDVSLSDGAVQLTDVDRDATSTVLLSGQDGNPSNSRAGIQIPSSQFWDEASRNQKVMMRKLLKSPGYRVRRSVLEATEGCFEVEMPPLGTVQKAINRLNERLTATANGWFIERSANLNSPNAEVWLESPNPPEDSPGQK